MKYLLWLTLPLYALDQWTKWLIVQNFQLGDFRPVIPGFFNLVRVHNTGMAFGTGNGGEHSNLIFTTIATIAMVVITFIWRRGGFPLVMQKVAAALLVSGIAGNVTDRLLPGRGYVVDFLDFYLGQAHWPSFNVADSCICVAAVLLFWGSLRTERILAGKASSPE